MCGQFVAEGTAVGEGACEHRVVTMNVPKPTMSGRGRSDCIHPFVVLNRNIKEQELRHKGREREKQRPKAWHISSVLPRGAKAVIDAPGHSESNRFCGECWGHCEVEIA